MRTPESSLIERRRFLQGAAFAGTTAIAAPTVLAEAAAAAVPGDSILLTVTLGGGNDGINFLGPFDNGRYRDVRGRLAIDPAQSHFAAEGQFFHPNLRRLATRFRRGDVAVVMGVGEPGLDRSHFSNLARWQSAMAGGAIGGTGWLGRWLDNANLAQFGGVAIGGQGVPLHMRGSSVDVTDLPRSGGGLYGSDTSELRDRNMYRAIRRMGRGTDLGPWVDRVGEVNAHAVDAARAVSPAFAQPLPESSRVTSDMVLAARLINLGLGTRVLNVWQSGYDTHDNQIRGAAHQGDHADLLHELDVAIDSFFATLNPTVAPKVAVMLYSEFGRRVEPNGSDGTDHGTAAHAVLIGRSVKGGYYGNKPSLTNLDDRGDLRVTMDFRRVYASVLEEWLQTDSQPILGGNYRTLGIFDDGEPAIPEKDLRARAAQLRSRAAGNRNDYLRVHSPSF